MADLPVGSKTADRRQEIVLADTATVLADTATVDRIPETVVTNFFSVPIKLLFYLCHEQI